MFFLHCSLLWAVCFSDNYCFVGPLKFGSYGFQEATVSHLALAPLPPALLVINSILPATLRTAKRRDLSALQPSGTGSPSRGPGAGLGADSWGSRDRWSATWQVLCRGRQKSVVNLGCRSQEGWAALGGDSASWEKS